MTTRIGFCLVLVTWLGFLGACGKDEETGESAQPLTNVESIMSGADRRSFVGRPVQIERVAVGDVVGDYVFWVGSNQSRIPVLLEGEMRGSEGEDSIQIKRGQTVKITGTVRLVANVADGDEMWKLIDKGEKAEIQNAQVYIAAPDVQIR